MDLETRVANLENLVNSLIKSINNNKAYTDADINGVRKSVTDITPYKETLTGYYGETEKTFYDAPEGNVMIFFDKYTGPYSVSRIDNRLIVSFDALQEQNDITILIQ